MRNLTFFTDKSMHILKPQLHAFNGIKVLAMILVFNSHCGNLYPVSALATGGALGNALFFVLSGYFLKIESLQFLPWIKRRIIQLYPPMLIVSIVYMLVFRYFPENLWSVIARFIWPTGYWFIGGLLLFNIIIYFFEKYNLFNRFILYSIILWLIYFGWYVLFIEKNVWSVEDHGIFRLIYYFYIYSFGYGLRTNKINLKLSIPVTLIGAIVCFIGQIGWKFIMVKIPGLMVTQFFCQILGTVFAILILIFSRDIEESYNRLPKKFIKGLDFWSKYSLEIYLSQRTAQRVGGVIADFPMNMAIAVIFTLIYSLILKKITWAFIKIVTCINMRIKSQDIHEV